MEKQITSKSVCLAVLPFENFTPDNELDYLAKGFIEDLITDLSRFQSLMIISSHSTLYQNPQPTNSNYEKLGANYLLKGNFRYRNEHVRIVIQLVDAETQHIIWAERYDESIETIFDIHDDIIGRVVGVLSTKIDIDLLALAQKKSITQLQAYDCWLRGMDHMKKGDREEDKKARAFFQKALEIDPYYARAYSGISLTYFNNWSCQLWEDWQENEKGAFEHAIKAVSLDESDYVSQMVLGRILNYRQEFVQAEYHLQKALSLNPNDADNLAQLSLCFSQLGDHALGIELFNKAIRLNPYHDSWYYSIGIVPYFIGRHYLETIGTGSKAPLQITVDLPAFLAASYAYEGDQKAAHQYLNIFLKSFRDKISHKEEVMPVDALEWVLQVTPCKHSEDTEAIIKGMELAGLQNAKHAKLRSYEAYTLKEETFQQNVFRKDHDLWEISFLGQSVMLAEVKGFHDLLKLLLQQGEEMHCTALMQSESQSEAEEVFDEKAKNSYKRRIQDLQEELAEAESMQDYEQAEKFSYELDLLIEHVTKATGLGGKTRKVKSPVERSRAAVTLRIRSAIKKISQSHPDLGKHFQNTIKTGTFCSYQPEHEMNWVL